MSFRSCIEAALADRRFGPKKTEQILERYENLRESYLADGHDAMNAERMAAEEAVKREDIRIQEAKKRKLAHAAKVIEVDERLNAYRDQKNPWRAAMAWVEMDDRAPWGDYVSMQDRVRGQAHAMLAGLLEKYGNKGAGLRRTTTGLENIVREIFTPNATGDAGARTFAQAWEETTSFLVRRFNAAGGTLSERTDWRLPQKQNRFELARVGKDKWVADHMEWLDWGKMRTPEGALIPPSKRQEILEGVFLTLKTNGHIKQAEAAWGGRSIGNQLDQSRFLIYKDSESWLRMHEAYGDGNLFDVMMAHVDTMAHQVAMVETFGPNPDLMAEVIKARVLNRAAQLDAKDGGMRTATAEDKLRSFDDMMAVINRETSLPETNKFGHFMAGTRNILTSAYLGSAALLAIPGDLMTATLTNAYNRTPVMRTLGRYLSLMNPASSADRQLAIRSGLIAENASRMAYAQTRMSGIETHGPAISRRVSDVVMRLSLMSPHTQAARWAFQMELMGTMADYAGRGFDELPFADMFRRRGITPEDWDAFRAIAPYERDGARFLRPDDLYTSGVGAREAEQLADKFMLLIHKEGKFAVPDASLRGLTALRGATRSGTIIGEIANSFAMFKNFPVTMLFTHVTRGLLARGMAGKIGYLGALAAGMTAVGALGIQMRQVTQGKDPRPMDDPAFFADAFLTGGAMGIWGDFLFSDLNRFGQGKAETVAGPVVGVISDTLNLTFGNVAELAQGKDTEFVPELIQFARRTTPGTSLWWARLLLERELWDQLQEAADPKAYQKWRNRERAAERDYGQGFWWKPGTSLLERTGPQRAPDMGAALGQ